LREKDVDAVEISQKQRHLFLLSMVKNNQHLTAKELEELRELEAMARENKTQKGKGKNTRSAIAESQILKTQKEAAAYIGRDSRTIRRWVSVHMPRTSEGYYIKSILEFYKKNEGQDASEHKIKQQKAEANLKTTKAELVGMELAVKKGEYIKKEEYERRDVGRILAVKRGLLALGRKVAVKVPPKYRRAIEQAVNTEVRHLIAGFARQSD